MLRWKANMLKNWCVFPRLFFICLCLISIQHSVLKVTSEMAPHFLSLYWAATVQSCPTLCDPIDGSPPGSPVPGILQARTLEWVAISFSNEWKWKVKGKSLSRVQLLTTPWTAAYQAPPSMGFARQEYWSGVPLPSPRNTFIKWQITSECLCIINLSSSKGNKFFYPYTVILSG